MFSIIISPAEFYDEINEEFIQAKSETLLLEHSLSSLSKWESKWCKPFLGKTEKNYEESVDYIRCMTLNDDIDSNIYKYILNEHVNEVTKYIELPMTATTLKKNTGTSNREVITAELIYYWMIALNVPFECQFWHLNRLLTLVSVVNIKQNPPKKMGKKEMISERAKLNATRKQQMNTKG